MTDKDKKYLKFIICYLLSSSDWTARGKLKYLKNLTKELSDKVQKLVFIQCIMNSNSRFPRKVLDTAREFLYADLISTIKE